jgi:hypothetical protein
MYISRSRHLLVYIICLRKCSRFDRLTINLAISKMNYQLLFSSYIQKTEKWGDFSNTRSERKVFNFFVWLIEILHEILEGGQDTR